MGAGGRAGLRPDHIKPDRIEAMILIGATSYFPERAREIMREVGKERPTPEGRDQNCAARGSDQIRLQDQFIGFKDSYDDMNFTVPYLGTIKARTLIVHGYRDEFFPVGMYRAIPGSELWIVPPGWSRPDLRATPDARCGCGARFPAQERCRRRVRGHQRCFLRHADYASAIDRCAALPRAASRLPVACGNYPLALFAPRWAHRRSLVHDRNKLVVDVDRQAPIVGFLEVDEGDRD